MAKSYPKCPCGALSRIIFFHREARKVVDYCWACYDMARSAGMVGTNG